MTAFDMSLVQRGARLRRSPFFSATQRYGARGYTVSNHMLFPICFDDLEAEYWRLVNAVTLWDVSVERQVEITGRDAFAFADYLTTRDLSRCAVGQAKYVLLTDEQGGIINDPVLLRLGENHFWLALADSDVLLWAQYVTSALYSPRLEKNIGYAMLPLAQAELGARVIIHLPDGERRAATVVPKPFVDPTKEIPRG